MFFSLGIFSPNGLTQKEVVFLFQLFSENLSVHLLAIEYANLVSIPGWRIIGSRTSTNCEDIALWIFSNGFLQKIVRKEAVPLL